MYVVCFSGFCGQCLLISEFCFVFVSVGQKIKFSCRAELISISQQLAFCEQRKMFNAQFQTVAQDDESHI